MGTFHVFVKDLVQSGAGVTIHCFCLRKTMWSCDHLARFAPTLRLWSVTEDFRCGRCGRLGKVRHIDVHVFPEDDAPASKREHVRKAIPIKEKTFGKRRAPARADRA
jgi:hypothetical protein